MTRPAPIILEVMRIAVPLHCQVRASVNLKCRLPEYTTRAEAAQPSK